jgi:sec-independent protein translocase protein TatB
VIFGLTFDKLVIIGIIAVVIVGPQRLPAAAARLAQLVRSVRSLARTAQDRVRDEMGPDFDDVDWKKLDPRQYDPRRIIREALLEDDDEEPEVVVKPVSKQPKQAIQQNQADGSPAPYDSEAT